MMEKLFEPYATTKTKGTGLGLAIVKKLVEEHGGSVLAENLEGGGTGIIVRLPLLESTRDGGDHHVGSPGERRQRA
jgi:signal transduction histidine kinase